MKKAGITLISIILFATFPPVHGTAADWSQWRGPNRDGISPDTGLLDSWPEDGPPLLWKASGLGGGYVTPSIADDRIYGAGYIGPDEVVWALDATDGSPIWSTRIAEANRQIGYGEGPRATPTIDGDLLFTLSAGGHLACLEISTGKIVWTRDLVEDFGGVMMSDWGFSESPLVDGNHLICTPGGPQGTVVALNKRTGEWVWQSKELSDPASYASLLQVEMNGQRQYIVLTGESVAGIAAEDGRVLWRAERSGRTAVCTTPIFHDNHVWVTSAYNVGCNLFKVTTGSGFKVEQVYADRGIANHHGGAILVDGHIYATHGPMLVCMEMATGKTVWRERSVGQGALGYADGHFYLRSETGLVALIEATPDAYVEKSRFNQPHRSDARSWPHPIIVGGRLYLRDMDILLCYDLTKK